MRVNTVAPGATLNPGDEASRTVLDAMTAGTPAGVVVQPDDIARAVLYLASADARMVDGTTLHVRRRRHLRHPPQLAQEHTR